MDPKVINRPNQLTRGACGLLLTAAAAYGVATSVLA